MFAEEDFGGVAGSDPKVRDGAIQEHLDAVGRANGAVSGRGSKARGWFVQLQQGWLVPLQAGKLQGELAIPIDR